MQKLVPTVIPNLIKEDGEIKLFLYSDSTIRSTGQITEENFRKFPDEFKAHFPKESNQWAEQCDQIVEHNVIYYKFQDKIRKAFIDLGLKMNPYDTFYKSSYVCEIFFHPFFDWCEDRLNRAKHPRRDFYKMRDEKTKTEWFLIYIEGYADAIAYVNNENDIDSYKNAIENVVISYEQESSELIVSANNLIETSHRLHSKLIDTMSNILKCWPRYGGYEFKSMNQCPVCKNIRRS